MWPRTTIHKRARLLENIIGSDCEIRGGAFIAERAVVGDHCRIGSQAVVKANVKVWPHKVVEDGAIPMTEVMRVLAPNGVACIKSGGKWTATTKPRPENIDEWTHFLHDAGNNAVARDELVGPPRSLQQRQEKILCGHGIGQSPVALGGVAYSAEQANRMAVAGYRMIFLGFDWSLLQKGIAAAMNGIVR